MKASAPCLICGGNLTTEEDVGNGKLNGLDEPSFSFTVKTEVTSDCEEENKDDQPANPSGSKKRKYHHEKTRRQSSNEWSEDEKYGFQLFLKWFGVPVKEKGKGIRYAVELKGWDGNSKWKAFPFCTACKKQLMGALEIKKMLERLEEQYKSSMESIRVKANSSEDVFENTTIYQKDARYLDVRQRIVTDFKKRYCQLFENKKKQNERLKKRRTSLRTNPALSRKGTRSPVVWLSISDKTTADKYLHENVNSETEESEVDWDTGFHHDDEGENAEGDGNLSITAENIVLNEESRKSKKKIPKPIRRKSTRKRKVVNFQEEEDEPTELPVTEIPSEDQSSADKNKDDYDTEFAPQSSTAPNCSETPKRKIGQKKPESEEDEDWTVNEAEELMSCDDDDFMTDDVPEVRVKSKIIFDSEKRTATYKGLVYFQQSTGAKKKYKCSKCNEEVNNVRYHYMKSHSDLFACRHCEYRATGRVMLLDHISISHKGVSLPNWKSKRLLCRICEKPLKYGGSNEERKIHEWSHKNAEEKREALSRGGEDVPDFSRKHQCDECGYALSSANMLRSHKMRMHSGGNEDKEIAGPKGKQCSECGGTFHQLRVHQRTVHGMEFDDTFECAEPGCGRVFKNAFNLDKHVKIVHQKIRPWKCTKCPREFSMKKNFDRHMALHLGIRPYQCDQCVMTFGLLEHLKKHSRLYHSEGGAPKRSSYVRGPTVLPRDVKKKDLVREGKYVRPSSLAKEPTTHFPVATKDTVLPCSSSPVDFPSMLTGLTGHNDNAYQVWEGE